ncbi:hypothetical protein FQR65_LT03444 [Abscondita terminalis]|nr:hypothetical protein FQR65_LT03444 [Abscondita terminalis]
MLGAAGYISLPPIEYLPAPNDGYRYESPQPIDYNGLEEIDYQGFNDGFNGYSQLEAQKHIYFFSAPNEPEYTPLRIYLQPKSQKNTKIIFIKAPHHGGVIPEIIAPPSLSEDKTLVYVLSKKPESQSITIPAGVDVRQTKPQVFFIKYNNKYDAKSKIEGGLQGHKVGADVPNIENGDHFVNTLDGNPSHGTVGYGSKTIVQHQSDSQSVSQHGIVAGVDVRQTKPQVFFIKYNNKYDAKSKIEGGLQGHKVGADVPNIENGDHFVNTLDGNPSHGSVGYGSKTIVQHQSDSESVSQHGIVGSGPY